MAMAVMAAGLALSAQGTPESQVYLWNSQGFTFGKTAPLEIRSNLKINPGDIYIRVLPGEFRQTINGIGGAITDSVAYNMKKLSAEGPNGKKGGTFDPDSDYGMLLSSYFGPNGSNYSMVRIPVGSPDFARYSYSYDDTAKNVPDVTMKEFRLRGPEDDPRDTDLISVLKDARSLNPNLRFMAAVWAPPAWMKFNKLRRGGPTSSLDEFLYTWNLFGLRDSTRVDPAYYDAYARYLVEYVKAYEKEGLPIWALSIQNENQNLPHWEAGYWSADDTINFMKDHLAPIFKANGLDTKFVFWDWNKVNELTGEGFAPFNTKVMKSLLADPVARDYAYGTAFHYYSSSVGGIIFGKEPWGCNFYLLKDLQNQAPGTHVLATEACGVLGGPWKNALTPSFNWNVQPDRYVFSMINDFEFGAETWLDWTMALDEIGGPWHPTLAENYPGTWYRGFPDVYTAAKIKNIGLLNNYLTSEVMISPDGSGKATPRYFPVYEVMKRFSTHVQPGAINVATEANLPQPCMTTPAIDAFNDFLSWLFGLFGLGSPIKVTAPYPNEGRMPPFIQPTYVKGIFKTAFLDPKTKAVTVFVGNTGDDNRHVKIVSATNGFETDIKPHSLASYTFKDGESFLEKSQGINPITATATSIQGGWTEYKSSNAVDGDLNTRWASNWNDRESLTLDLGSAQEVHGLSVCWEWGADSAHQVYLSNDPSFKDSVMVADIPWGYFSGPRGNHDYRFPEALTLNHAYRYIRVQGVRRKSPYGYSFFEIGPVLARVTSSVP